MQDMQNYEIKTCQIEFILEPPVTGLWPQFWIPDTMTAYACWI